MTDIQQANRLTAAHRGGFVLYPILFYVLYLVHCYKQRCYAVDYDERTDTDSAARVLFTIVEGRMVLLHGFIKKSQKNPSSDMDLAKTRLSQLRGQTL